MPEIPSRLIRDGHRLYRAYSADALLTALERERTVGQPWNERMSVDKPRTTGWVPPKKGAQ